MAKRVSPRNAGTTAATRSTRNQGENETTAAEQGQQSDELLAHAGDDPEHAQPGGGLAAGALQFVVKHWIFKGNQIQAVGVLHQPEADVVGEFVAQQAVEEVHCAR